jgi:hypothetical protein
LNSRPVGLWQHTPEYAAIWNAALSAIPGQTPQKLDEILNDPAAIRAYEEDPFDPHAVAELRIGAYEKVIIMKYFDNLLDWGDALFSQDTWESITQATTLYMLAYDILGPRPLINAVEELSQ